jgi:ribonuclease BN (tRNA processing enzyme)
VGHDGNRRDKTHARRRVKGTNGQLGDEPVSVRVTFLGAGDAFNSGARCHASYLVSAPSTRLLLDCGATALMALKRCGTSPGDIDAVFVSHLHGDHFSGVAFLLLESVYESQRRRPLTIVGPPGTQARLEELYRCLYRELACRPLPFELRFVEVNPSHPVSIGSASLLPFRVPHQQNEISLGVRLSIDGKTILYSGDTGWTEELVTQSQGTDLFICECCYFETRVDFHLDYPRIAENAARFGCRRLVLTHIGREVLARRNEVTLELAHDGLVVEL